VVGFGISIEILPAELMCMNDQGDGGDLGLASLSDGQYFGGATMMALYEWPHVTPLFGLFGT
jgi:hypothetical protein